MILIKVNEKQFIYLHSGPYFFGKHFYMNEYHHKRLQTHIMYPFNWNVKVPENLQQFSKTSYACHLWNKSWVVGE